MSTGVRFTFAFCQPGSVRAISHLVNDFMSFPVRGGRYQSGALHTMGLRRYNWRPNIQWSPPAPLCDCPLTLLPLIFLQPFMCLIVFVSTAGLSVLVQQSSPLAQHSSSYKSTVAVVYFLEQKTQNFGPFWLFWREFMHVLVDFYRSDVALGFKYVVFEVQETKIFQN